MKFNTAILLAFSAIVFSCNQHKSHNKPVAEKTDTAFVAKPEPETDRPVHWSYIHEGGPAGWASLSTAYAACGSGQSQSPVDIISNSPKGNSGFKIEYKQTPLQISHNENMRELINNGHTIQVTPQNGSTVTYEGKAYNLKQFHFHTPSEHTIDGRHFPMEIHFVHEADDKNLLVIGVLVQQGKNNQNFETLLKYLPDTVGQKLSPDKILINPATHLPQSLSAYHYIGSLTTPPCTENVQWVVLQKFIEMGKKQIEAISSRIKNNNRPTQQLYNRKIKVDELHQ